MTFLLILLLLATTILLLGCISIATQTWLNIRREEKEVPHGRTQETPNQTRH